MPYDMTLYDDHQTIRSRRLPNGAHLLTEEMPGVESVALGVWTDAGSADELPEEYGQTHFLEHMFFKGTTTRSAFELAEAIEDVGGQVNAYTDREMTHVYTRVLSEHLHVALDLLADMVCHSAFPPDEVTRECQVITEEILKYEAMPDERVHDLILEGLWHDGALGHSVLGSEEHVRAITHEELAAVWRRDFSAERVLITIAGRIEHEAAYEMVCSAFADLPDQAGPLPKLPSGKYLPFIVQEEDEDQVNFCWGCRSYPAADERNYALTVLDATLGASTTSRLFQEIREKRGLAYDITSYTGGFRHTGLLCATGACGPETFPAVLRVMRDEIEKLRTDGITPKELLRAKEQMKVGLALGLENTADRMRRLAMHQFTWGQVLPLRKLIDRIDRITLDDVHQVAAQLLDLDRWCFTAIGPVNEQDVSAIIKEG